MVLFRHSVKGSALNIFRTSSMVLMLCYLGALVSWNTFLILMKALVEIMAIYEENEIQDSSCQV